MQRYCCFWYLAFCREVGWYPCGNHYSGGINSVSTYAVDADAYTEEQLNAMTISQITELADSLGYIITATKKAEIITEFLSQQG